MKRAALIIIGIVVLGAYGLSGAAPPRFEAVQGLYRASDLTVRARDGEPIQEVRVSNAVRRFEWVALADVPPHVREAIVQGEDKRFWLHGGVDWRALGRAALSRGSRGGASTLTMQLAGMLAPELRPAPGRPRSHRQKIEQIRGAWALEGAWSKEEILEAYLNLVPFRGEIEGISGAARLLFGKGVGALTPDEAVITAVLVRAPNASRERLSERACRLKSRLGERSPVFAVDRECRGINALALQVTTTGVPEARLVRLNEAPHVGRFFAERDRGQRDVRSTIDGALQRFTGEQLRAQLAALADANVADGAVLVVRNDTGEVVSYLGNGGSESSARYVDGVRAKRQAGSTLKPFLYALAFERRLLTADAILNDAPIDIPAGIGVYRPRNYDNSYHGPVTVRAALGSSLNIPAVLTVQRVGVAPFVDLLGRLDIGELQRADTYGPSVALGSPVVSLWELVNAYRTLAQGGFLSPLVLSPDEPLQSPRPVIDRGAAAIVADILSDRESRAATFGLENTLATPYWTAVKTGTSKDMTDNWCVGFSRDFTVGVWVGNFSGAPMHNVSGVTGAAPLWARVFDFLSQRPGFRIEPPSLPEGVIALERGGRRELYLPGTASSPALAPVTGESQPTSIISPADGALFAIDPDIPLDVQRIAFEGRGAPAGSEWVLNGSALGSARERRLWAPQAGRYTLALRGPDGHIAATAGFVVRGGARGQ